MCCRSFSDAGTPSLRTNSLLNSACNVRYGAEGAEHCNQYFVTMTTRDALLRTWALSRRVPEKSIRGMIQKLTKRVSITLYQLTWQFQKTLHRILQALVREECCAFKSVPCSHLELKRKDGCTSTSRDRNGHGEWLCPLGIRAWINSYYRI